MRERLLVLHIGVGMVRVVLELADAMMLGVAACPQ